MFVRYEEERPFESYSMLITCQDWFGFFQLKAAPQTEYRRSFELRFTTARDTMSLVTAQDGMTSLYEPLNNNKREIRFIQLQPAVQRDDSIVLACSNTHIAMPPTTLLFLILGGIC